MRHFHLRILTATLPFLLSMPYAVGQPVQPPTRAEAQAALNPPPAPAQFTKVQLDQMLAPIALYPDQLLTQLLMAATFPDQLVDAAKWLQDGNNAQLRGDDLPNALQPLPWDPSVKSLIAFPQIIVMLTDHLDWTEALGAAFANQEVEVFSRVQFLRERAKQAGKLQSTSQIAVREQDSDIIIEPADPNMIYVPVYNPAEVYGDWPDRNAPPVYIPPPPALYGGAVGAGIAFSAGLGVVAPLWGWGHPDWHRHTVVVDPGRYQRITNENVIQQNHVTVEHDTWRRSGPVNFVPEGRRPAPPQPSGQAPAGTIRPSEFAHREFGPNGRPGGPPPGQPRPGEGQPGPRFEQRPAQAQPGPGPGGEHPPEELRREQRGEPGHPPPQNEAHPPSPPQGQPGPQHGEQRGEPGHPPPAQGQPGPHPGEQHGEPGHPPPQNEARPPAQPQAQPGPHPGGQAQPGEGPHPEHHAEPSHPQGGQQGEQHPPQPPGPQQHAAPQPQQQHAPPPQPQPQPQAQQQPHPGPPQGPPPQAGHPPGPGPQQPHPGGQPQGDHKGDKKGDKKGDEDKH